MLLARALPDISRKPWQEDEAVAGLISAQPLGELLHTVVFDRGGAPLHFLLAHLAFALDGSPRTLRWLSLVFALATIPLCYDLARLLAGRFAGFTAAALAATSQLLVVYSTFGRMYSLFAFTSALSLDLFVRGRFIGGLLPVLVHPFGIFVLAAQTAAGVAQRRWGALPVAAVGSVLAFPYLRLGGRYDPTAGMSAVDAAVRALGGFGIGLAVLAALAAIGAWTLPRAFTATGLLILTVPPLVLIGSTLSPRHFIYTLPVWTTFVAAGLARMPARAVAVAAAIGIALLMPNAIPDPRDGVADSATAAAWVREHVRAGDALYPYSPVFLAALPKASVAQPLPREPVALERALRRAGEIRRTLIAIPRERSWFVIDVPGPFTNVPLALARAAPHLHGTARAAVLQLYATSTEGTSPQRSSRR